MGEYALISPQLFDGEQWYEDYALWIADTKIKAVLPIAKLPTELARFTYEGIMAPGFVDLQVNGGGGVLFNNEPTLEALEKMMVAHCQHGTTMMLPTLITAPWELMKEAVAVVNEAITLNMPGILGIHLEGPFLNPQRKGAHQPGLMCQLATGVVSQLPKLTRGTMLMTLAPELTDELVIKQLITEGFILFAGHSNATEQQANAGFNAGITGVTHLYNAMSPMTTREPGLVGAALTNDQVWVDIIADGYHIHPANMQLAIKCKPPGKVFLVTDAMATVGAEDYHWFMLDGERIEVSDGRCVNQQGVLAGAHLGMNQAVKNILQMTDLPLDEALRMASFYPAAAIKQEKQLGKLKPGFRACVTVLDKAVDVLATVSDGVIFPSTAK
ncbi:N-acetylglucosamine-6-phosphate deacetylase [Endozoicomonas sp. SM1973]|uniref:N-acetylglucosamine-6-phosphate deacetylase n=1 Tax=Spartinivicinus marinus TaxID=2994442 RepID=A0A853IF36_9GAMM|nr:N-acetylglucosamine-6-phosphate deacetylase [Spartinivicinus marinus]MCX4025838.1 N-acetylglucosamine-6-phosphate deacetylase [Spartinivicinus marinus]NYZ68654.1 N-acetylglucosamine-6-phosphate deacetylase [Spartinivicinus marinus]